MTGGGLREIELSWDDVADRGVYPFSIPALAGLGVLALDPAATFLDDGVGTGGLHNQSHGQQVGVGPVAYRDTEPFELTSSFLESPERFFRHLSAE